MKRSSRRLQQQQQIVRIKAEMLKKQKQNIIDNINEYVTPILAEVERSLENDNNKSAQEKYKTLLAELDKASALFTDLEDHIDSILYVPSVSSSNTDESCDKECAEIDSLEKEDSDKEDLGKQVNTQSFNGKASILEKRVTDGRKTGRSEDITPVKEDDEYKTTCESRKPLESERTGPPEDCVEQSSSDCLKDSEALCERAGQNLQSSAETNQAIKADSSCNQKRSQSILDFAQGDITNGQQEKDKISSRAGIAVSQKPVSHWQDTLDNEDVEVAELEDISIPQRAAKLPKRHSPDLHSPPQNNSTLHTHLPPDFNRSPPVISSSNAHPDSLGFIVGQNLNQRPASLWGSNQQFSRTVMFPPLYNSSFGQVQEWQSPGQYYPTLMNQVVQTPFGQNYILPQPLANTVYPGANIIPTRQPILNSDMHIFATNSESGTTISGTRLPERIVTPDAVISYPQSALASPSFSTRSLREGHIELPKTSVDVYENMGHKSRPPSSASSHALLVNTEDIYCDTERSKKDDCNPVVQAPLSPALPDANSVHSRSSDPSDYKKSKGQSLPADLKHLIKKTLKEIKGATETPEKEKQVSPPKEKTKEKSIPQLRLKKDEIVMVAVGNIDDPWTFHAQMTSFMPEIAIAIEEAVNEGNLENVNPSIGQYCLAKFTDDKYYRARIDAYHDDGEFPARIQVKYIDFGSKQWVSISDLLEIPAASLKYPAQAVLCALAKVGPVSEEWTEQAAKVLRQHTQDVSVQLRVVHAAVGRSKSLSMSSQGQQSEPETSPVNPPSPEVDRPDVKKTPLLVDLVARRGKAVEAKHLAKVLIKADLGCSLEVADQLELLEERLHVKSKGEPQKLQRLQQLIEDMKATNMNNSGRVTPTEANKEFKDVSARLKSKSQHRTIPTCFQLNKFRSLKLSRPPSSELNQKSDEKFSGAMEANMNGRRQNRSDDLNDDLGKSARYTKSDSIVQIYEKERRLLDLGRAMRQQVTARLRKSVDNLEELELSSSCSSNSKGDSFKSLMSGDGDAQMANSQNGCDEEIEEPVIVKAVTSPSSFFVHRVNEELADTQYMLIRGLNGKFETQTKRSLDRLSSSFTLQKHSLCCAVFSQDGFYYRGMVLEIPDEKESNMQSDSILLLFIDYGDFEWVQRNQIYPLPTEFQSIPPLALWCCLNGIQPVVAGDPSGSKNMAWSSSVVEKFKELIKEDKPLYIIASKSDHQKTLRLQKFQWEPLQVLLVDKMEEENLGQNHAVEEELCLNYELIQLGLASLTVPQSTFGVNDSAEVIETSQNIMKGWDPMEEEFHSSRNSYKINIDNPGVALVGYEAGDVGRTGRKVCVFYNRRKGCYKGNTCPDMHIKVDADGLSHDKISVHFFDEDQSSLLPNEGEFVTVTVATVLSPAQFYATLPWGPLDLQKVKNGTIRSQSQETLQGLMDNMQAFYDKRPFDGDLTVLAPGQAMAAKVKDTWVRAKVVDSHVEDCIVQVRAVDFGWTAWVSETALRELELRFLHLPPQAVECSLAGIVPEHGWSQRACYYFAEFVSEKVLVAHVVHRHPSGSLNVELYDTSCKSDINVNQSLVDAGFARAHSADHLSGSSRREVSSPGEDFLDFAPA